VARRGGLPPPVRHSLVPAPGSAHWPPRHRGAPSGTLSSLDSNRRMSPSSP
jgi:hypothetical protein